MKFFLKKRPGLANRPKKGRPSQILFTEKFRQEKEFLAIAIFVKSRDRVGSKADPQSVLMARSKRRILAHYEPHTAPPRDPKGQ